MNEQLMTLLYLKRLLSQDVKIRKPVETRESSRLQSAAKLLRSLSKTKDVKSSEKTPSKSEEAQELPDRNHPAYLSEGKGSRKRRSSAKENKESKGKDRSHSFHGKVDKKERKYVIALERQHSTSVTGGQQSGSSKGYSNNSRCEETVVSGARSILLTEDNLVPIPQPPTSPDLIQDLPRPDSSDKATAGRDNGDNDDDDYVEADSLATDHEDAPVTKDNGVNIQDKQWSEQSRYASSSYCDP